MRKLLSIVLLLVIVFLALGNLSVQAQEPAPYVCSTSANRYEFRDIPQSWLDTGGYWYIADDVTLEGNVLKVAGIPEAEYYNDDVYQGEAAFGNADRSVILKGDANTAPCDLPKPVPVASVTVYQAPAVVSTGRTCVAKYTETQVVLVCNG